MILLPKISKRLINIISGTNLGEYEEEFCKHRLRLNLQKCKIIAMTWMFICVALLILDYFIYISTYKGNSDHIYWPRYQLLMLGLAILWFLIMKLIEKKNNPRLTNGMCIVFYNISVYWCILIGVNNINNYDRVLPYIICALTMAAFLYLNFLEASIIYVGSMSIYIISLVFRIQDGNVLCSHIVNILISVIFSMIISRINYTRLSKDFLSEKNILKAKEILLATNEKLKMYERVRTDFFANISHELRTPLNVIYSAEQMAERMVNSGNINSKKLDKYLKMMKQNCYRLIKLINNLIDITKIEAANFEIRLRNMDIVKVVEDITLSVADYIENKGIILIFDTEIEEKVIACDPDVVERVMLNLLSNAVKFTEEGGNIFVNIYESEGQVYLSVKDTGVGMSEKAKEQIFSRFVQVDKSARRCREGSGIGLSLVKSLLEVHGGSISVESRLGEGSEFTVVLWDRILEDEGVTRQVSKGLDERIQMVNIEFSEIYK